MKTRKAKPRTWCYSFKPQFAPQVEAGSKVQTIRRERKDRRRPVEGDLVKLYSGLRTKNTRLLATGTVEWCMSVRILFREHRIVWDGQRFHDDRERLARADGFSCLRAMLDFFTAQYGQDGSEAFDGYCVSWRLDPLTKGDCNVDIDKTRR